MPRLLTVVLAGLAVGAWSPAAGKQGISTRFVEVLVEGVPLASRYVLESKLVEIANNSEFELPLRFDPAAPSQSQLRAGYEPIPDTAWVSFEPRSLTVSPGGMARTKVVLYIPDDPALVGRRFQTMLFLRAEQGQGGVAVGLKPRLLFSIGPKGSASPAGAQDFPRKLASISPYGTASGKGTITFVCPPLKVENFQDTTLTYDVADDPEAIKKAEVRPGHHFLDPSWIEVSPRTVVLPPRKGTEMTVTVRIPVSAEHFGRTYVAGIRTVASRADGKPPADVYNMVRVDVPALGATATVTGKAGP